MKPAQYLVSALSPAIQKTGRDINHSPSTTAGVNEWRYTSICLKILDTEGVNGIDLAQDSVVAAFFFRIGSKPSGSKQDAGFGNWR
jgi:hypothetical protein